MLECSQNSSLGQTEEAVSNTECVEESSQDCKHQDWHEIIQEGVVTQSDGRVQDDRRKQEVEEDVAGIDKVITISIADGLGGGTYQYILLSIFYNIIHSRCKLREGHDLHIVEDNSKVYANQDEDTGLRQ